jgi:hypothetical protein
MISWLADAIRAAWADCPLPAGLFGPKAPPAELSLPAPLAAPPAPLAAPFTAPGAATAPWGAPATAAELDAEPLAALPEHPASPQQQMTVPAMVTAMSTRMFR